MNSICCNEMCTGCAACQNTCSHNAIKMVVAKDGFLRPIIDKDTCVDCGLCVATCPVNHPVIKFNPISVYMAWTKDRKLRMRSSSGGIFPAIATEILVNGGVVVGASYDLKMNLRHYCIESKNELAKLQSSKYVQSDINESYKKTKEYLKSSQKVYFVGTPCQVAGLRSFLHKDYDNLITSDFVCHGCPSNDLFQKQIKSLEKQYHAKVEDLNFRSKKRFGQGYDCELILSKEGRGRKFLNAELLPYFYGFWKNITLRDCCYQCRYATSERVSDITLGDFWTVKKYHKGIKTSEGISLCLVNNRKGEEILRSIPSVVLYEESMNIAVESQGHLKHSVKMPSQHKAFVERYSELSWEELCRAFLNPPISYIFKMRIRNLIKIISFYKLWK